VQLHMYLFFVQLRRTNVISGDVIHVHLRAPFEFVTTGTDTDCSCEWILSHLLFIVFCSIQHHNFFHRN